MTDREQSNESKRGQSGPKVIRVTPEGRREVDPMSIIGSKAAGKHLKDIAKIKPTERDLDR